MTRSMCWQNISRHISISTACSVYHDKRGDYCEAEQRQPLQDERTAIKRHRAPDVACIGVATTLAHIGVVNHHSIVDAAAAELQAECASHGRFRPAGIRRGMVFRIA